MTSTLAPAPREAYERAATMFATLPSGAKLPMLGLGTWMGHNAVDHTVAAAVSAALKHGYRHIDTAAIYQDEKEVGQGIAESGVPRDQIFVTTKLWHADGHPSKVPAALERSLERLQLDWLDLWLLHWPFSAEKVPTADTWRAMAEVQKTSGGKVKAIGVCNFTQERLQKLIDDTQIKPDVLQIELHPWLQQQPLLDYCKTQGIVVVAYMPFGNLNKWDLEHLEEMLVDDPSIVAIAGELGISVNQLLISWALQRGTATIPKSNKKERIIHNFGYFPLSDDVMNKIAKLDRGLRFCDLSKAIGEQMF